MFRPLFVLRTYNDIDHIVPVIWKFIKMGSSPTIIFNSSYDYKSDNRIKFLISLGNINIIRMQDQKHEKNTIYLGSGKKFGFLKWIYVKVYNQLRKPHTSLGKIYRKLFFDCSEEYNLFKENNFDIAIFEWGNPEMKGEIFEKIFTVAKGLGIPIFSLPHGLNVYLNSDIHQAYVSKIKKGLLPNFKPWNKYDKIIVQSKFHADHMNRFGIDDSRILVWGSARFSPEWQEINSSLYEEFLPSKKNNSKVNIVFMLPHWVYNVDKKNTIDLIYKISENKNLYIVIKDHTRGDTGTFPENHKEELSNRNNIEFNAITSSTALISWSDIVINFGSSIGLDAIYKGKAVIYPRYLHKNFTIHDIYDSAVISESSTEVIEFLNKYSDNPSAIKKNNENDLLFKTVVYGSKEPFNILDYYYEQLISSIRKSKINE